jgi:hypothetical protein
MKNKIIQPVSSFPIPDFGLFASENLHGDRSFQDGVLD